MSEAAGDELQRRGPMLAFIGPVFPRPRPARRPHKLARRARDIRGRMHSRFPGERIALHRLPNFTRFRALCLRIPRGVHTGRRSKRSSALFKPEAQAACRVLSTWHVSLPTLQQQAFPGEI